MRKVFNLRTVVVFAMLCAMAVLIVGAQAQQAKNSGGALKVTSSEIGGVVTSSKGPEAGVWVVAETTETPTRLIKIVVTDDQGRYLLPDLPKATYDVWVRGYGLVDSTAVQAAPGKQLNLKAVVAPTPADAAKVFPAVYWLSLIKVPDKSEFPIKATPMPPYKGQMAAAAPAAITPIAAGSGRERRSYRGETHCAPGRVDRCNETRLPTVPPVGNNGHEGSHPFETAEF